MADVLEQSDFSLDVQDNGRLCVVVYSLTSSSDSIAHEVVAYLRDLPPFRSLDDAANQTTRYMCVRILTEFPYWSREAKSKSEALLNGSKRLFAFLGVAKCQDVDDFNEAEASFKHHLDTISNNLMIPRCLIFGNNEDISRSIKGQKCFVLLNYEDKNVIDSCSAKLKEILTHCMAVVYSNLKVVLSDKKELKKAGSLPKSTAETMVSEEQIKYQQARSLKAQADFHMLSGCYDTAIKLYNSSFQLLRRPIKEYLWVAAVLEGLISVHSLQSNQYESFIDLNEVLGGSESTDGHIDCNNPSPIALDFETNFNISDVPELDVSFTDGPEDKVDKDYQVALNYYNKVTIGDRKPLVELYLKYSSYLIQQKKYFRACEMIEEAQNVFDTDSIPLKMSFYLALGWLYRQMNFSRKTAFMIFTAAQKAVSLSGTTADFGDLNMKAYNLLKYSFDLLDYNNQKQTVKGWPALQAHMFREYAYLCLELNFNEAFIKWSWSLIENFHSYLSDRDIDRISNGIREAIRQLEMNTEEKVVAPFPLSSVPHVVLFKPQPLSSILSAKQSSTLFPSLVSSDDSNKGPFLLSMIGKSKKQSSNILWVQGDPAEVLLIVSNPLPLDLKVEKMTICLEGSKVNTFPSSITLPPSCEPQQFVLLCIPTEPGSVTISGYTANIFGLANKSVMSIPNSVKVLPSLPQLRARIFPPGNHPTAAGKRRSVSILETGQSELLDGEKVVYDFQLQSIGDVPIAKLKITIKEQNLDYCQMSWNAADVESLFPLNKKNELHTFPLTLEVSIPFYLRVGSCKVFNYGSTSFLTLTSEITRIPSPSTAELAQSKAMTPPSSPARIKRSLAGSLRRSNAKQSNSRQTTSDGSLLESLDLHQPGNPHNNSQFRSQTLQPEGTPTRKIVESRQSPASKLIRYLEKQITPSGVIPPAVPSQTPSAQICETDFIDSLNLEHPLAETTSMSKRPSSTVTRSSMQSDNWDSISENIAEFDSHSNDRLSLKSDPGTTEDGGGSNKSDSLLLPSVKSSSLQMSPSLNTIKSSTFTPTSNASFSSSGFMSRSTTKKKRVGPQSSVPIYPKGYPGPSKESKSFTSPFISPPTGAQKIRPQPPSRKTIKSLFCLQYTGGEGAKEGYYRELNIDLVNTIRPTLVFDDFSISAIKGSPDLFSFDFVIENVSPYFLLVYIEIKQEGLHNNKHKWDIEVGATVSVSLPMKRFTLHHEKNAVKEAVVIKEFCEHIVSLLDIKWEAENKKGSLSLTGLQLPQSTLSIIRPIPILFDVNITPDPCSLGIPVSITIQVMNNTSETLPMSLITLCPFTLNPNGQKVDSIKHNQLLYTQALSQRIPQLKVEELYSFSVTLIFLCHDEYLIDILHNVYSVVSDKNSQDDEGKAITASGTMKDLKSVTSTVKPVIVSGSTSQLPAPPYTTAMGPLTDTVPVEYLTEDINLLSTFIPNSRTYIGPQLTFNFKRSK